tara:strand:+ start:283 stop:927 length:645 start_codon:yes stop_codon:yes gene_type:complete
MKKGRKDFIFDLETIGANVFVCPVVDVAYTIFEWDRFIEDPYTFEEVAATVQTQKADVSDQMTNYGCSFNKADVAWWESLPKLARDKLNRTSNDLTAVEFCDTILTYLREEKNVDYWWSRGNTFDPVILNRLMLATDRVDSFNQYLKFYKARDVRSHIDAKFNYTTMNGFVPVADEEYWKTAFIAHDSSHDVAADVMRLQTIHRAEHDLEQTAR